MIERERSGMWEVYCDGCSESEEVCADTFQEVIDDIKYSGWWVFKSGSDWLHHCQSCKVGSK
jgi:hypothetical protein